MQLAQQRLNTSELGDYFTWITAVWVTGRGKPLDFSNRKYLVQIYQDQSPNIVYIKGSQMGISERLISEAIWLADQESMNSLYCFPAQAQLQDFVQARLNPVLEMSDYLKQKIDVEASKTQKLGLKKIGKGHIYFRGSQNAKQIISVDADCTYLDERDRFVEENVPFIDKRTNASTLKWRREASTPTLPAIGIHMAYLNSDQRVWEIECKKCHTWQELDFFKHVDFEKKLVRCQECHKPIDRSSDGRWTPLNPKSDIVGYKINGIYNPANSIPALIAKYRKARTEGFSSLQQFYNQDLGLPYEESGQRIQVSELNACKRNFMCPTKDGKEFYAGVDIGIDKHHCVVATKTGKDTFKVVWAGTLSKFFGPVDSLEAVLNSYNVKVMVVDKKPETSKLMEMIEKYPGRVYATDYPMMKFSVQEYFQWDDVKYELRLDRTISLDYLIADIQAQRMELPQNIETVENFYDHLRASTRVTEKNPRTGIETARWIEKGADHFLHALNYARMACTRGVVGEALLDYYAKPAEGLAPGLVDWIRINGHRIFN